MAVKRYHRKSRAGCDTCKRRRVKCDEATPKCGACALRQESCSYPPQNASTGSKRVAKTALTTTSSSQTSPPVPIKYHWHSLYDAYSGPSSRLATYSATRTLELRLMHQWSTTTYLTSVHCNAPIFRDYAVTKALQHTYLMDILLAFTSLHSASLASSTTASHDHVAAALHYQNKSISEFNEQESLVCISKESLDPVCLMTALHAVVALVASLIPATPDETLESVAKVLMRVRRYTLGMKEIVDAHSVWADSGELKQILEGPAVLEEEEGAAFTSDKLRALTDAILENMDLDDAATPFFRSTLEKLEKAYTDSNGHSVVSWLGTVEPKFFQKVDMGQVPALIILVCWGALNCVLENMWWMQYSGRRIVKELSYQLEGCDGRWNEILEWCYEQVGISGRAQ
ncbi:hypothetical protein BKA58DRAFT_135800 [Alternaria rosae]|uniref:uncharacterized protein n=1 Tax=Alternaria rosae TaxID=1187941 RepID=UPI001E8E83AC|nr:uncharacterized protein BKA58DRAFT_135800 [Alternaria rosae]KAH6876129.1 hypothetical protein BKA58DRAFT_135800 [Alternaria rosae]